MAMERLRYFTGLFLEEQDFRTEQNYHLLMRRQLNYALFSPGVLFGMAVAREAPDRVRVDPGMAVDRDDSNSQGREIVLTAARTLNLNLPNGSQVYIVASYREQPSGPKPPQNIEARFSEDPLLEVVQDTGGGFTGDKNVRLILAKVTVGDLSAPNLTERQLAAIRLGGGGPGAGDPTVTSLAFNAATSQGSAVVMTITGTNLGNTPSVAILDTANNTDATITAAINSGASSGTTLVVNLTIGGASPLGDRRVRVQTATGAVVTSPAGATSFKIIPPPPTIASINPVTGVQGTLVPVTITGTNLAAATTVSVALNNNSPDGSITVNVISVAVDGNSLTAGFNIGGAAAIGGRRISVATPSGSAQSAVDFFTVAGAAAIQDFAPASQVAAGTIIVRGSNIRDANIANNQPAAGTTVTFVDPANAANNVAAATIVVLANQGNLQRVRVTIPVKPVLLPNLVNLVLQFQGATATAPTQFTFL